MNTQQGSSSALTRGSRSWTGWMPDQVGHDRVCVIPAHAGIHACQPWMPHQVGHDRVCVIPAYAGIHACQPWMPDQVGHDSFDVVGHDSLGGYA